MLNINVQKKRSKEKGGRSRSETTGLSIGIEKQPQK